LEPDRHPIAQFLALAAILIILLNRYRFELRWSLRRH